MTYSIRYKQAIDRITENEETQNYLSNMTQYGSITNLILLSIEAKFAGLDWDVIMQSIKDAVNDGTLPQEDEDEEDDPQIENYLTFDSAWKQIRSRVPEEFFSIEN